jgi:hypothetical protein
MNSSSGTLVRTATLALLAVVSSLEVPKVYACTTCEWGCGGGSCSTSSCLSSGNYDMCMTDGQGRCDVVGEGCR